MLQARPRPRALSIPTSSRRITHGTTSSQPFGTPSTLSHTGALNMAVPPQSVWSPDTPSLYTLHSPSSPRMPRSPMNPFLLPPQRQNFDPHALFPMAAPLLPASPLSMFDGMVSPTSGGCGVSTLSSASRHLTIATKTSSEYSISPLSPRFLYPRTPPCAPERQARRRSVVQDRRGDVMRKVSMVTVGERKQGLYKLLAIRGWRMMMRVDRQNDKRKKWLTVR
jgi:hypothetical protein